jgi:hypothetical protein
LLGLSSSSPMSSSRLPKLSQTTTSTAATLFAVQDQDASSSPDLQTDSA